MAQTDHEISDRILKYLETSPNSDKLKISNELGIKNTSSINRCLDKLERQKRVVQRKDGTTRPLWSLPPERTSEDELIDLLKKYSLKEPQITVIYDNGRYHGQCRIELESKTIECTGKREIESGRARVRAAHEMLSKIVQHAKDNNLKREASKLYSLALHRGSEFKYGEVYRAENRSLEYKGSTDHAPWEWPKFKSTFKKEIGRIISGFINRNILDKANKIGEAVFGVHSNGTIRGIKYPMQSGDKFALTWNNIQDSVKLLFDDCTKNVVPSPLVYGATIRIETVDFKKEDFNDVFILFLIVVHLPIDAPQVPCYVKNKDETYYVRHEASTREATDEERNILKQYEKPLPLGNDEETSETEKLE
jgi:hypothetical protein